MYKHILVPTDGSKLSLKAARAAAALAEQCGARLTTLYVIAPFDLPSSTEAAVYSGYTRDDYVRNMREYAKEATTKVEKAGRGSWAKLSVVARRPWEAIIATAKSRKADLIVMSSHGRGALAGLLLGSETQKVLAHSKVPVLVCR